MLDPRAIRLQVENLKLIHPEILEDDEAWLATLESETDFDELLTSIVRRKRVTEGLIVGTQFELDEIKTRKARLEHRIEALRELAFKIMQAAELNKRELPIATLSIRRGTPSVVITDEAALPDILCKFERKPDKDKIKKFMADGSVLQGATMSNGQPSISIRIK